MLLRIHLVIVLSWIVSIPLAQQLSAQDVVDELVSFEVGELPIILSAPHGGQRAIPGVRERRGTGVSLFRTVTDSNTDKLAVRLADEIEERLGARPYVISTQAKRTYIDMNRRATDAYESSEAQEVYDAYHQAISNAREAVTKIWGHGLLIDLHGQALESDTIIRGTQNGETVSHLVNRFGREAHLGRSSLFGRIAEQGINVMPEVGSDSLEHPKYDGGYIVYQYGSHFGGTVDAIQLELGFDLRKSKNLPSTASKLAEAIAGFASDYLPTRPWSERVGRSDGADEKRETMTAMKIATGTSIGVFKDKGVGKSVTDLLDTLAEFEELAVTQVSAEEIRAGGLSEFDVLIHPGGSGSRQARELGDQGREAIRRFVRGGGGFIGICAGAYLASADYAWSLGVIDAKVLDRKHWNRGTGPVQMELNDRGKDLFDVEESDLSIQYGQGPLLAPGERDDIPDYESLAIYRSEITKNGAVPGVMIGTTAIAIGSYGQGRVLCFSPHPELTDGLEGLVGKAIECVSNPRSDQLELVKASKN